MVEAVVFLVTYILHQEIYIFYFLFSVAIFNVFRFKTPFSLNIFHLVELMHLIFSPAFGRYSPEEKNRETGERHYISPVATYTNPERTSCKVSLDRGNIFILNCRA